MQYSLEIPRYEADKRRDDIRILVVEDDLKIASFIVKGFKQSGFSADHAEDGETGITLALQVDYDAAIVDLMLPEMDGLSVIKELKQSKPNLPVIILSAKRSLDDRIKGLEVGGDDYLTKPFSFAELLARVKALIRRSNNTPVKTYLSFGDLYMDLLNREVTRDGKKIYLQPREFSMLEYLMRNAGKVITKTLIMEQVYDYYFDPQTNVVDVLVCRLRNKIDRNYKKKLIHTIRGVGYVLKEP